MSSGDIQRQMGRCGEDISECTRTIGLLQREISDVGVMYALRIRALERVEGDRILVRRNMADMDSASDKAKATRIFLPGIDTDLSVCKAKVTALSEAADSLEAEKRRLEGLLEGERNNLGALNSRMAGLQRELNYWLAREAEEAAAAAANNM